MNFFRSEAFQGTVQKKNYFEGWYCKQVSADRLAIYSFIPGISLNKIESHAFIQVINGITARTHYLSFPVDAFWASSDRFDVTIGNNRFSSKGISLNLDQENVVISGELV